MRSLEYLNFKEEGDDDATESTYHSSGFKPTPYDAGFVETSDVVFDKNLDDCKQLAGAEHLTGYFLRSSVGASVAR